MKQSSLHDEVVMEPGLEQMRMDQRSGESRGEMRCCFEDKRVDEVIRTRNRAVNHKTEEGEGGGSMERESRRVSG